MKKYFNSFEGLRIFAFLNVFLLHINPFRITNFQNNAAWAVSFFFMVSGFLYGYKLFSKKNMKMSDTKEFTLKKIIKIYPLYLLTLIIMIPFSGIITNNKFNGDFFYFIKKLIFNLTLTQSFSLDLNISYAFNGVSWFLSDFIFLMLITIPLMIFLKKMIKNKKQAIVSFIISIIISFAYVYLLTCFKLEKQLWLYVFPISRLFEYITSLILGIIFYMNYNVDKDNKKISIIYTLLELITIVLLIVLLKYMSIFNPFDLSVGWIIPNMIILYLFGKERGLLSKILGNKLFRHLGSLTFDAYLIHQVVNMYVYVVPGMSTLFSSISKLKVSLFMLVVTFLIAEFNQKENVFSKISGKLLKSK